MEIEYLYMSVYFLKRSLKLTSWCDLCNKTEFHLKIKCYATRCLFIIAIYCRFRVLLLQSTMTLLVLKLFFVSGNLVSSNVCLILIAEVGKFLILVLRYLQKLVLPRANWTCVSNSYNNDETSHICTE